MNKARRKMTAAASAGGVFYSHPVARLRRLAESYCLSRAGILSTSEMHLLRYYSLFNNHSTSASYANIPFSAYLWWFRGVQQSLCNVMFDLGMLNGLSQDQARISALSCKHHASSRRATKRSFLLFCSCSTALLILKQAVVSRLAHLVARRHTCRPLGLHSSSAARPDSSGQRGLGPMFVESCRASSDC